MALPTDHNKKAVAQKAALPADHDKNDAAQKTVWLLIAVALNAVELALPRLPFLPWLKPGFANVITVLWIIKYGCRDAVLYTALRIWISGFYFGFSLFTFSLSLCGGLLSTLTMSAMWLTLGKRGLAGTIGMAVVGALSHNAGQIAVVYFMMARNMGVLGQIPFMLAASVVFGGMVGALAPRVARAVGFYSADAKINTSKLDVLRFGNTSVLDVLAVVSAFAVSILLMFTGDRAILVAAAVVFSFISLILTKKPAAILYPFRFYMLFLFIGATHLFFTYGTKFDAVPFITREGAFAFVNQSLRLWCWLQTAHIFKRFKFRQMFIAVLYRFFPTRKDTLEAGMTALEHFPDLARFAAASRKKYSIITLITKPNIILSEYINEVRERP